MNKLFGFIVIFLTFCGCTDILEEDISNERVVLIAPANGAVIQQTMVNFWWEALEGATSYRLQVVSPSFDSVITLVADEIIEDASIVSLELTLGLGTYQWKVIGENFGYETDSASIYNLTIESDTAMSLSDDILVLTQPTLDEMTNEQTIVFSWQALANANSYNFQIASPDFSNNAFIISNELVDATTLTKTLAEGTYLWRVRGQNDASVSPFTERTLTIDLTSPGQPILNTPANGASIDLPVMLDWTSDLDSERDTLYVYEDSLMANTVLKLPLTETEYTFSNSTFDAYFWRVRTVDGADNTSLFSELRKFLVQ